MEFSAVIFGVEIIVGILLGILYIKSRLPKETIEQQAKLITALEKRIGVMEDDQKLMLRNHVENEKKIATLEGQIKVYKELPLQDIANSLKALENLPNEFERITNANGEKIMDSISHVTLQTVDRQTVNQEIVRKKG